MVTKRSTRELYHRLYNFPRDYVYGNSQMSPKINYICNRLAIHLLESSIRTSILLNVSLLLVICIPIYMTLVLSQNRMVILIVLPFTDPTTQHGFMVNFIHQSMTVACGFLVLPAVELVPCMLKNTISVTAAVIENSILEFNDQLRGNPSIPFSNEMNCHFRNLILQISDFNRLNVFCLCASLFDKCDLTFDFRFTFLDS